MSRKDYIIVAGVIHSQLVEHITNNTIVDVLVTVSHTLADRMKHDNPNFNRTRFLAACGVE